MLERAVWKVLEVLKVEEVLKELFENVRVERIVSVARLLRRAHSHGSLYGRWFLRCWLRRSSFLVTRHSSLITAFPKRLKHLKHLKHLKRMEH
jgi:hypothetical protein